MQQSKLEVLQGVFDVRNLLLISKNDQCFSIDVIKGTKLAWLITIVYASLVPKYEEELWSYLHQIGNQIEIPWVLVGNYNKIIHEIVKIGVRIGGRRQQDLCKN